MEWWKRLEEGHDLNPEEATAAAEALADEEVAAERKREILVALSEKGESADEVAAFAKVFRGLARTVDLGEKREQSIDVVGTGGDHFGSFNISTTTAFVLAAGGVPVAKHGNRSITSKSGSSDFLSAVGVVAQVPDEVLQSSFAELNFCFFFAPAFHPAFKSIMPVRKALAAEGKRTVFNILGPLINPVQPPYALLGVFAETWVVPMAQALNGLGLSRGAVVHGRLSEVVRGIDEVSAAGENRIRGCGELRDWDVVLTPDLLGLEFCNAEVLKGGTALENLEMLQDLVEGQAPQGLTDTILMNASLGFYCAGVETDLRAGVERAREVLRGGALKCWLAQVNDFYAPYRDE